MKKIGGYFIIFATVLFLVTVYSMGTRTDKAVLDSSAYIEVGGDTIPCVPPGTEFVTYNGKVMRIIAVVPLAENQAAGSANCWCPHCCDGVCARITRCTDSGTRGLCVIYLTC